MTPAPLLARRGRRRRAGRLTPMIDVVFLLLVFFMLAARLGPERALPLGLAGPGAATDWEGAPRLVTVTPDAVRLNGVETPLESLAPALEPLMPRADAPVVLRAEGGADLARLVAVVETLEAAGIARMALAE